MWLFFFSFNFWDFPFIFRFWTFTTLQLIHCYSGSPFNLKIHIHMVHQFFSYFLFLWVLVHFLVTVSKSLIFVVVVQLLNHVWLFVTPWTAALQTSLSSTISENFFKFMSIELLMPSNHLILCCPLLLLPSVFPRIRVFS